MGDGGVENNNNVNGINYYFDLTDQLWHDLNSINGIPSIATNTSGNCAVYDSDRNVFFIVGGSSPTVVVFNVTTFENENYENVWQYDLFGQAINQTGLIQNLHSQACVYYNDMIFTLGGIENDMLQSSIFVYVLCLLFIDVQCTCVFIGIFIAEISSNLLLLCFVVAFGVPLLFFNYFLYNFFIFSFFPTNVSNIDMT